jgi:co-chaperonin GroES (HSP10)
MHLIVEMLSFYAQVLYSKFGFMYTDMKVGDDDYILIREDDIIAVMPRSGLLQWQH